jgi:hypothetical protein
VALVCAGMPECCCIGWSAACVAEAKAICGVLDTTCGIAGDGT